MDIKIYKSIFYRPLLFAVFFMVSILFTSELSFAVPFIDKEMDLSMGRGADKNVISQYGIYPNKPLQLYVNRVGQKLVSKLSDPEFDHFFFKVLDSSEINAFALPGGYIYVTRGILGMLNSEAELAGVLGHEIGHVVRRHGAKQVIRQIGAQILSIGAAIADPKHAGQWLMVSSSLSSSINSGYGREAELESDAHGILNLQEAGYNPGAVVDFLSSLREKEIWSGQSYHSFFATHPDTKSRMIKAKMISESIIQRNETKFVDNREIYLRNLQGMSYGGRRYSRDPKNYEKEYVDIYQVKKGDTFQSIAKSIFKDVKKDRELAVLNGKNIEEKLLEGEILKVVKKGVFKRQKVLKLRPETH
ncbi:MAG: M48 family metalloprotease [Nitrospinales bacterium]